MLAIVGVAVAILVFIGGRDEGGGSVVVDRPEPTAIATEVPPEPTPTATEAPPEPTATAPEAPHEHPVDEPPESGSLRELVAENVGPFSLTGAEEAAPFIEAGASEALLLNYSASGGATVIHVASVFPSPEDADAYRVNFIETARRDGAELVQDVPLRIDGRQAGTINTLVSPDQSEILLWTNGGLFLTASGAQGDPQAFFDDVPY